MAQIYLGTKVETKVSLYEYTDNTVHYLLHPLLETRPVNRLAYRR